MNIKLVIAGTVLSAFFAATPAIAGDNDYLTTAVDTTTTQVFVIKHAYLLTTMVVADKADKVDDMLTSR